MIRWGNILMHLGVQVIAIAMLIFGLIVFLLGILPPILLATRGAGASWQALLALPTVLAGCSGALLLLAFGSLLLTLVKISENAGARSWKPGGSGVAVTPAGAVERPVMETGVAAVVAVAGAEALAAPGQAVETEIRAPAAVPAAVTAGVAAARVAGHEAPQSQAPGRGLGEAGAVPVDMVRPSGEGVEVGEVAGPVEEAAPVALVAGISKTPQEEVEDLKAQLAALDAQLAEVREYSAGPDESLPPLETEEPSREAMVESVQVAEAEAVTPEVASVLIAEAGMETMTEPAEAAETGVAMPEAMPAAVEAGVVAAEAAGHEAPRSQTPERGLGETSPLPAEMAPPWSEEGEAEEVTEPVEQAPKPSPVEVAAEAVPAAPVVGVVETAPEDVDALRAQLGALEAQLAELGEYPAGPDESLPPYGAGEPPLDAHAPPRLPGSDDMARIAAEMASVKPGPPDDTPGQ
jgi:hypothetical protein